MYILGEYKVEQNKSGYKLIGEKTLDIKMRYYYKNGIKNEITVYTYHLIVGDEEFDLKDAKRRVDHYHWEWEYYGWSFKNEEYIIEFDENWKNAVIRRSINGM